MVATKNPQNVSIPLKYAAIPVSKDERCYLCIMFSLFSKEQPADSSIPESIYDFAVPSIDGGIIDFSAFKGKKIMIVNTASFCGYTPQYEQLEALYRANKEKLVIVGVPSNDFMFQEPLSNKKIEQFCKTKYDVTFPMAAKAPVKGKNKTALYRWLTEKKLNGYADSEVEWNFQKYLIDEAGLLVHIFPHKMPPDSKEIADAISS